MAETISSLTMNAFVCSVKSYLEVSSRDCLVASNKRVHLLFGSWFIGTSQTRTETRGKMFEKTSFQVRDRPIQRTETRQG